MYKLKAGVTACVQNSKQKERVDVAKRKVQEYIKTNTGMTVMTSLIQLELVVQLLHNKNLRKYMYRKSLAKKNFSEFQSFRCSDKAVD